MVSQLFVKNIGKVLKPWYKQIKAYSDLPSGIHTYDVVKGFSDKKGFFEVLSYKNKDGKLLQRVIKYADKEEVITKNYTYDNYFTRINTRTTKAGALKKNEYKTLCKYDDGSLVELTEEIGAVSSLDKQMARYLRPKEAPRIINVEDPWGNPKFTSPKCSVGRMTFLKDRQYLPTVISNFSKERTNERMTSIEKVLANRNNLPVERTATQRVSQQLLNPQAKINRDTYYGVCCCNGKVKIWDELYETRELYETMGHEFNHSKWFKFMNNTQNGNTVGMGRKNVFTARKLNNEELIIQSIPYEEQSMERLAFNEETKIAQKFDDMFDKIVRFFER